jgi:hypothetical protein
VSSVRLKKDSFLSPKEMSFWTWQGLQDVGLRFDSARLIYKKYPNSNIIEPEENMFGSFKYSNTIFKISMGKY